MSYEYTWRYGIYDLCGQNTAWLQSACRERGLSVSGNRIDLLDRLLGWELK